MSALTTGFSIAANNRVDLYHPTSFKQGVRVVMLMLRAKDGGSARTDRRATKKIITTNEAEFDEAIAELRTLWQPEMRIYSSINARDVEKAIRLFAYRQLDASYFADKDRHAFYYDLENRWISCLKSPKAKASGHNNFLLDIDTISTKEGYDYLKLVGVATKWSKDQGVYIHSYSSRNGYHIITKPFNPTTFLEGTDLKGSDYLDVIHRDVVMLWSY